jgi:hypothetical protein
LKANRIEKTKQNTITSVLRQNTLKEIFLKNKKKAQKKEKRNKPK